MTRFGYSKENYRGPLLVPVGWLIRRAATWAALWLALGACGGGILTARMLWPKTQRQTEAPLPCVERPGSPARMILHLPGEKKKGKGKE